jgi:hypothetical protein
MLDLLPFPLTLDATEVGGVSLWALALYIGFSTVRTWVIQQLYRWFNFAERSLYFSAAEFEETRKGRESQNAFYASVLSVIPFLLVGALCHYGLEVGLGRSWAISMGMLTCIGCGVFALGRREAQVKD